MNTARQAGAASPTRRNDAPRPLSLGACFDCLPADDVLVPLLHRLPLDALLRCTALSRGWHALLSAQSSRELFVCLDFGDTSAAVDDEGLASMARRAGGALRCLDVTACHLVTGQGVVAALQAAADGAAALECLATCVWRGSDVGNGPVFTAAQAEALRAACPQLDARLSWVDANPLRRTPAPPSAWLVEQVDTVLLRSIELPVRLLTAMASESQTTHMAATLPASTVVNVAFLQRRGRASSLEASLHVAWVAGVGQTCTDRLSAEALTQSGLQVLSLYDVEPDEDSLADIWASSPALQFLNLSRCSLGDDGAGVLAAKLATDTQLLHLDLEANGISDAGAASLAAALTTNAGAALRHLDLSLNPIGDAGWQAVADALVHNTSLRQLLVSRSRTSGYRGLAAVERVVAARPQPLQLSYRLHIVVRHQVRACRAFRALRNAVKV